jgi:NAD(P)H-dependent flavin oxidoreductase YrpB (nitropropane dioxygenase family)
VIEDGEMVFGPRDEPDLAKIAALGLPFWVAGAAGTPQALRDAQAAGAVGVQVGTVFALSSDSGLRDDIRTELLDGIRDGSLRVRTDPLASPTGFPFKVADVDGTVSDLALRADRPRLCDLGFLRTPYQRPDGSVGYRCASEPVDEYVRKGGDADNTAGRACVCNGLTVSVGLGQTRKDGFVEPAIVTLGSDTTAAAQLLERYPSGWSATDVVDWLVSS